MIIEARSHYFSISTNDLKTGGLGVRSEEGWTLTTWITVEGKRILSQRPNKTGEWTAMRRAIEFIEEMAEAE